MKILLVIFAFTLNPQGEPENFEVVTQPFDTLAECNQVGRNLRYLVDLPDQVITMSYCVSAADYAPKA